MSTPRRDTSSRVAIDSSTRRRVIVVALSAAMGGLLFGYETAVINGAVDALSGTESGFGLSSTLTGLAVGGGLLGCAVGAWFAGHIANRRGRVPTILAAAVMFLLSAIVTAFAPNVWVFIAFRIVGGFGVGLASVIGPAYIAEIAPTRMRGFLTSFQQFAIGIGVTLSMVANASLASVSGGANEPLWFGVATWRWMLFAMVVPALVMLIAALKLPETPRYLVMKGDLAGAERFLARMGEGEFAAARVQEIHRSLEGEPKPSLSALRGKTLGLKKVVWIAMGVALFQQLSGINIILYFDSSIWQSVGFGEQQALNIAVIRSLAGIAVTVAAMFMVDRVGRRRLLLWGSYGMSAGLAVASIGFANATQVEDGLRLEGVWAPITLVAVYFFALVFAMTWGPVMWVVIAEIFPNNIRAIGVSVAATVNWIGNYLVSQTFPMLQSSVGISGAYVAYTIFAVLGLIFVLKWVPETNGVALEDMSNE
ncbi:sugar porter family MFS transporter [Actinomycetaceae bacterium L2_0104]